MGSLALSGAWASSPNDDIRVAVVGLHKRGKPLMKDVIRTEGARLVAVCDTDTAVLKATAAWIEEEAGIKIDKISDYRVLLNRKDIDAVVLATPNHWHALQTVWACQAGKDVYVEKPACYSIWEGRKMLAAAAKYRRIVQVGHQNRSDSGLNEAFPWILEGHLGKIEMVRGLCYDNRNSIGKRDTPLVPPNTVDYDTWLGPALDRPMYRSELHYDWHWDFNTGNGDIGNQGVHEFDLIRWLLGEPDHPLKVQSFGGRFGWDDAGETPNMQISKMELNSIPVVFEVRDMWVKPDLNAAPNFKGRRVGVIVNCEGGEFRGGRGGGDVFDREGKRVKRFKGDGGFDHFPAFIRGMRSRKQSDLACSIEKGYRSACLPHMSNISYQVGKQASDKEVREFVSGDEYLRETYDRYREQLGFWNIDFKKNPWTLGSTLEFDPAAESFVGGVGYEQANDLINPKRREKFSMPDIV